MYIRNLESLDVTAVRYGKKFHKKENTIYENLFDKIK